MAGDPVSRFTGRDRFMAVGLMSGTSMDGVDAALVELDGESREVRPKLLAFKTTPYPAEQRDELMELAMGQQCTAEEVATLSTGVAVAFANAFFTVCREGGVEPADVDFIGSHGQTVAHVPPGGRGGDIAGTLQLGPPGMMAALTGVTTVGDFRSADLALGGQGAPLAPYVDYLVRRSGRESRIILNLGGIANLTYLPKRGGMDETLAFDTGPGNMVLDALFRALFPGDGTFDVRGAHAASGRPDETLVQSFLGQPYFERRPPKSAGHAEFGVHFAWEFLNEARRRGLGPSDVLASAALLTARSVVAAVDSFVRPVGEVDAIYAGGGGARNEAVMRMLSAGIGPVALRLVDELGIPAEAKEAVDFAVLAREALLARVNVISTATGSVRAAVLGTIAWGSNVLG